MKATQVACVKLMFGTALMLTGMAASLLSLYWSHRTAFEETMKAMWFPYAELGLQTLGMVSSLAGFFGVVTPALVAIVRAIKFGKGAKTIDVQQSRNIQD